MNGRVNIVNQFDLFDKIPTSVAATPYTDATKGILEESNLSNVFFSAENITEIQKAIIVNVKQLTNYIIPPQNSDIIKNIMWFYYLEFSAHKNNVSIEEQVKSLNKKVLEHSIPGIIESINADVKYRHDISHMHVPMERGIATSKKGLAANEFKTFF